MEKTIEKGQLVGRYRLCCNGIGFLPVYTPHYYSLCRVSSLINNEVLSNLRIELRLDALSVTIDYGTAYCIIYKTCPN